MIKLTKLILSVKESTEDLIEDMSIEYSKEVEEADNIGLPRPKAPKYKMSLKDYDVKEAVYYVDKSRIIDVSEDEDGITIIGVEGLQSDISVKEKVQEVVKLISDEQ